jgi:lauroyl/myristoyl acyltransferase
MPSDIHSPWPAADRWFAQALPNHLVTLNANAKHPAGMSPYQVYHLPEGKHRATRAILGALSIDRVVTVMGDAMRLGSAMPAPFLDQQVMIRLFVARLSYMSGAPSFWRYAFWRDKRIVIELAPLPMPAAGEAFSDFAKRWTTAFAEHLADAVLGPPENILLNSRLWRPLAAQGPENVATDR